MARGVREHLQALLVDFANARQRVFVMRPNRRAVPADLVCKGFFPSLATHPAMIRIKSFVMSSRW
jgi:hypothetical protein